MSKDCHPKDKGAQCHCAASKSSMQQNLTEMEWERGIWPAAREGDLQRVQQLLQKDPANSRARDSSGYTAAHYAARSGHVAVVTALLGAGADVNCQTLSGGVTPLHRAAYMGRLECVKVILEHKADPFLADNDGCTALHKAVEGGHPEVARMILNSVGKAHRVELLGVTNAKGATAVNQCKKSEKYEELWKHVMQG